MTSNLLPSSLRARVDTSITMILKQEHLSKSLFVVISHLHNFVAHKSQPWLFFVYLQTNVLSCQAQIQLMMPVLNRLVNQMRTSGFVFSLRTVTLFIISLLRFTAIKQILKLLMPLMLMKMAKLKLLTASNLELVANMTS